MKYLMDTDICIYLMNRRSPELIRNIRQIRPGDIGVSSITVSELQYGAEKSRQKQRNQQRIREFLAPFSVMAYDESAAAAYGDIRAHLETNGIPIGPLDQLIAAHAMGRNLILITNNEREFRRIPNLIVENWSIIGSGA